MFLEMFYLFTHRFGRRRHSEFPNCGLGWAGGVEGEGRGRFRVGVEGGGRGGQVLGLVSEWGRE